MSLLSDFKTFLKSNNLLVEKPICHIAHSCCDSYQVVIDFDYIKDDFCKIIGITAFPLKSSDCLYLNAAKSELFFMEIKDLDQTIQDYRSSSSTPLTDKEIIERMKQSFEKWGLDKKIIDSYILILSISGYYAFNQQLDRSKVKVKYILLFKISSRDYVKYRISNLPYLNKIRFGFLSKTDIVRAEDFDKLISFS